MITPPGNVPHELSYANEDLIKKYQPPGIQGNAGNPIRFAYDTDNRIQTITRPDKSIITFTYVDGILRNWGTSAERFQKEGPDDQPTRLRSPDGLTILSGYQTPVLTSETLIRSSDSSTIANVNYGYNNLLNRNFIGTTDAADQATSAISYIFDKDDLMTQAGDEVITRDSQNGLVTGTTLENIQEDRKYNSFGELNEVKVKKGATELYFFSSVNDRLGRLSTAIERILGESHSYLYHYDLSGRLDRVDIDEVTQSENRFYANSDREVGTIRGEFYFANYDSQDRLQEWNDETFTYTANGEILTKKIPALNQTVKFTHDAFGKLKAVKLSANSTISYQMDGRGRRASRSVNGVLDRYFLYQEGDRLVAELSPTGALLVRYVYGTKENIPDYMIKSGVKYKIVSDRIGSVRLVVNVSNGHVLQRLDYDEWGRVLQDTKPGFQAFGFAGGMYDSKTKMLHFNTRDYDPEVGRWLSKNPNLFNGRDVNLYSYNVMDPVNRIDGIPVCSAVEVKSICKILSDLELRPGKAPRPPSL
jgi:RHS repeat-associated protein